MNYSLDVVSEYQNTKKTLFRHSLVYSLILTLVIVGDVLLVTLAKENYTINMIIAIVITILFGWLSIYLLSNVYRDMDAKYRYFKGYDSGLKPKEEVEFLKKSDELCRINGLYVYPVYVRYSIGLNRQDKVIFCFNNNLEYHMGDKLTISTYQRIIIEAEKHA